MTARKDSKGSGGRSMEHEKTVRHSLESTASPHLPPIGEPRIYLAAERTFLAWVRTALALMGFGFVIARFALFMRELAAVQGGRPQAYPTFSPALGFVMVCLGVIVIVVAPIRHLAYIRALERGVTNPPLRIPLSLVVAVTLALVGVAIAIHILIL
jgi:putative membrane protein